MLSNTAVSLEAMKLMQTHEMLHQLYPDLKINLYLTINPNLYHLTHYSGHGRAELFIQIVVNT